MKLTLLDHGPKKIQCIKVLREPDWYTRALAGEPPEKHLITWVPRAARSALAIKWAALDRMKRGERGDETHRMGRGVVLRGDPSRRQFVRRVRDQIACDERAATRSLTLSADACKGLRWLLGKAP